MGATIAFLYLLRYKVVGFKAEGKGQKLSVLHAVSRIASLLAIAILGIVVLSTFNHSLDNRIASLAMLPDAQQFLDTQRINLAGAQVPPGLSNEVSAAVQNALASSFVDSFRLVMLIIAVGLAIASAVVAALMIRSQRKPS